MPSFCVTKYVCAVAVQVCLLCGGQAAAEGCNAYLFPQSVADVSLATVRTDRLPILRDDEGCPTAGSKCAGNAYLIAGNQVLAAGTQGTYRCVAFFNGRRQTTGWVASGALSPAPAAAVEGDWVDVWKRVQGDAAFTIRKRGNAYIASGLATYAVRPGNVRTGTANGTLRITPATSGAVASFTQNADDPTAVCKVTLKQSGRWLLVNDGASDEANSGCGGMGVTFNGIYQRTQHATGTRPTQ